MAYALNTRRWRRGDLVLDCADAKQPSMLLRVTGYTRDGFVRARYVQSPYPGMRGERALALTRLLDPAAFGIDVATLTAEEGEAHGRTTHGKGGG